MPVPQKRNQKKHQGRRNTPAKAYRPYRGTPLIREAAEYGRPPIQEACDDELANMTTGERLLSIHQPGDWLKAQANRPPLGERLLGKGRGMLLDSPHVAMGEDSDYSDFESDLEDLYDFD